jgi:hypothetical protein
MTPPKGLNEDELLAWFEEHSRYHEDVPDNGRYSVYDPRTSSSRLFSDDTRELFTRFDSFYHGRTHLYFANCTQFPDRGPEVGLLNGMIDSEIDITLATLRKYCVQIEYWAELMGYERTAAQGLTLARDHGVSFHRGKFGSHRAYFVRHSAIEYIWLPESYVKEVRVRRQLRYQLPIGDVRACRTAMEARPRFGDYMYMKIFRPEGK